MDRSVRSLFAVVLAAGLFGCATSVRVISPPEGAPAQSNPVTFTVQFHSRANTNTFKATLDPTSNNPTVGGTDITNSFSQPWTPGGQATATVTVPTNPCGSGTCTENHELHVGADFSPGRAFDVHGSELAFRVSVPAGPPPPPPPRVSATVTPMGATAIWGPAPRTRSRSPNRTASAARCRCSSTSCPSA